MIRDESASWGAFDGMNDCGGRWSPRISAPWGLGQRGQLRDRGRQAAIRVQASDIHSASLRRGRVVCSPASAFGEVSLGSRDGVVEWIAKIRLGRRLGGESRGLD